MLDLHYKKTFNYSNKNPVLTRKKYTSMGVIDVAHNCPDMSLSLFRC
jgi:hypothetical protein